MLNHMGSFYPRCVHSTPAPIHVHVSHVLVCIMVTEFKRFTISTRVWPMYTINFIKYCYKSLFKVAALIAQRHDILSRILATKATCSST